MPTCSFTTNCSPAKATAAASDPIPVPPEIGPQVYPAMSDCAASFPVSPLPAPTAPMAYWLQSDPPMIALLLLALAAQDELPELKTRFWELHDGGKKRAVVLVHGLQAQLLDAEKPHRCEPPSWLSPESAVVKA